MSAALLLELALVELVVDAAVVELTLSMVLAFEKLIDPFAAF
jgi:hypothetical protein